jgi:hypothetical protein
MHFTVTFKRHVCKFFFINNMADWHHACVRYYNEVWIQETGPLTQGETHALEAFAGIAWKYPYGSEWLGRPIVVASSEEQALKDTEALIGTAHAKRLRDVFLAVEPRFETIWARDEVRLGALAERLCGTLQSEGMARAVEVAERLYGTTLPDLEVLLILSRGQTISGGANEGPGRITIAALEAENVQRVVELVLHESIHLLEADGFRDMYRRSSLAHGLEAIKGDRYWNADQLVREAIVEALVPGGVLAPLIGGTIRDFATVSEQHRAAGRLESADLAALAGYYAPLMQEHIDVGKPIDAGFVERAIGIFTERRGELAIGLHGRYCHPIRRKDRKHHKKVEQEP